MNINFEFKPITVLALLLIWLLLWASWVWADPPASGRRYDKDGQFDGTYREQRGRLRLYDENGKFEGTAVPDARGRLRRYDKDGQFEGDSDEDSG